MWGTLLANTHNTRLRVFFVGMVCLFLVSAYGPGNHTRATSIETHRNVLGAGGAIVYAASRDDRSTEFDSVARPKNTEQFARMAVTAMRDAIADRSSFGKHQTAVESSIHQQTRPPYEAVYHPQGPKLEIPRPAPPVRVWIRSDSKITSFFSSTQGRTRKFHKMSVSHLPPIEAKLMALAPDRERVLYTSIPKPRKDELILWTIDLNGKHKKKLADIHREMWVATPVWSPNSKKIAYVRTTPPGAEPGLELWVMNADGSDNHKLVSDPAFNASIFYGSDPHPLSWTAWGDLQFKDYKNQRIWTVDGQTGQLTYQKVQIAPPADKIPLIDGAKSVPILSQNDPRWRYDDLGACGLSIGNAGCALTATSMSFSSQGFPVTPRILNRSLKRFACPLYWSYAASNYTDDKLRLIGHWGFDWNSLDKSLKRNRPALVWLTDASSSSLTHWVLVVGGSGQHPRDYRIYDPYDGTTWKSLYYYTSKGYEPMRVYAFAPAPPKTALHSNAPK